MNHQIDSNSEDLIFQPIVSLYELVLGNLLRPIDKSRILANIREHTNTIQPIMH